MSELSDSKGERIERVVEIYESADAVRGLGLREGSAVKQSVQAEHTAGVVPWCSAYQVAAACVLLLLCVLLLTVVTVLGIKYNILSKDNNHLQTSYNNLITQRDQLQTSYNNIKNENHQLQFQRDQLLLHRDQLQRETSGLQNVISSKFGWRLFNSSLYKMYAVKLSWDASNNTCTAKGANLVIVNSKEEQEFISKYFKGNEAWIGLTDKENEGIFKWVDGSLLTTEFWMAGEPNNAQNEDCVATGYEFASSNLSSWIDYSCSYLKHWICEMKIFN